MSSGAGIPADPRELPGSLGDLAEQIAAIRARTQALTAGRSSEALNWRPAANRWSIAECIEHLNLTADMLLREVDKSIAAGVAAEPGTEGVARHSMLFRWLLPVIEPPPKKRFKAKPDLTPRPDLDAQRVIERFAKVQDEIVERLERARGIDLTRTKVRHPLIRLMSFRLGEIFTTIAAHERRHLQQAEQVTKAEGFPA